MNNICLTQDQGLKASAEQLYPNFPSVPPPPPHPGEGLVQGNGGGLLALIVSLVVVGKEEGRQSRMPLSLQ